jgi:N-acetylglucosaminyl-diphospho-decaprenol L-rhamnosyltransferase
MMSSLSTPKVLPTASLDIIIVNWNTGHHLRDCLESIIEADKSALIVERLVVVDNASSDDSLENIPLTDPAPIVIQNQENRGFAAACNQGAQNSKSDYLLFLNPDTRLYTNSLVNPVNFMQQPSNDSVGICGVRLVDEVGTPVVSCARFPSLRIFWSGMSGLSRLSPRLFQTQLMSKAECDQSREVDQVIGAFFLVRGKLFELNHGFDERFFVYFEEVDFSLRARRKGYSSYYLADTFLYHRGGGSSERVRAKRLFYSLRSRIQYGFKNFSFPEAVVLLVLTLTVELVARLARAVFSVSRSKLSETINGYWEFIGYLLTKG